MVVHATALYSPRDDPILATTAAGAVAGAVAGAALSSAWTVFSCGEGRGAVCDGGATVVVVLAPETVVAVGSSAAKAEVTDIADATTNIANNFCI